MDSRRGSWRYRFLRLPWWVRGLVVAPVAALGLVVVGLLNDDDDSLLGEVGGAAVGGLVVAVLMSLFIRASERRLFDGGGRTTSTDERIAVVRAVDCGRWPEDPQLHAAAERVAALRLRQSGKPVFVGVTFGLMTVIAVVNVVLNGPWWWIGVALWVVLTPLAVRSSRRTHAAALAFLNSRPERADLHPSVEVAATSLRPAPTRSGPVDGGQRPGRTQA